MQRDPPRLFGALLAAIALVFGPALYVLGLSDFGHPHSFYAFYAPIFQSHVGFYFFSVLAYAIVITGLINRSAVVRVCLAQLALLGALGVLLVLTFPFLFGLGESASHSSQYVSVAIVVICVLIAAVVHRRVLRSGVPARIEVLGHAATFAVPSLVFDTDLFGPTSIWAKSHIFGEGPVLFGLVPFVAIVASRAPSLTLVRWLLIIATAAAPVYFGKAAFDLALGRTMPFLWPVRIVTDFMPAKQRNALIRELSGSVSDKIIRLGMHWYRFHNFASSSAWPNQDGIPDRLIFLELGIPKEQLGLPAKSKWIQLRLKAWPQDLPSRPLVGVRYEDLTIEVDGSGEPDWPSDEKVREIVLAYVVAARVPDRP